MSFVNAIKALENVCNLEFHKGHATFKHAEYFVYVLILIISGRQQSEYQLACANKNSSSIQTIKCPVLVDIDASKFQVFAI